MVGNKVRVVVPPKYNCVTIALGSTTGAEVMVDELWDAEDDELLDVVDEDSVEIEPPVGVPIRIVAESSPLSCLLTLAPFCRLGVGRIVKVVMVVPGKGAVNVKGTKPPVYVVTVAGTSDKLVWIFSPVAKSALGDARPMAVRVDMAPNPSLGTVLPAPKVRVGVS